MVTKGVKETNASMMNLAANALTKPQGKKDGDVQQSFQRIFDKQTGREEKVVKSKEPGPSERLEKRNARQADRIRDKQADPKDPVETDQEWDEEELAATREAVMTAMQEMLQRLTEVFGVSEEELQGVMQELGMEEIDVLSEMDLRQLVMTLGGVKDSMELLTDGETFGKLQELLAFRQETLEAAGDELKVNAEQFLELARRGTETEHASGSANPLQGAEIVQDLQETATGELPSLRSNEGEQESAAEENPGRGEGNLVLQQMLQNEEEIILNPVTEETSGNERVDADMIMRQIMDHMKAQLKPDVSSLEMQLHPASLGNLQVQLTSRGGAVTAQFFAQNEAVKAALETQMIQLQENFEEQGIKVDAIEVAVQTHQFERNLDEQGREEQERQQTHKGRGTRRLRIDEPLTPEQLDELTKDERLAAEMMRAGGGTVDFMA